MKVSLLGGTGHLGKGLALRLAVLGHDIVVGSRRLEKAEKRAEEYKKILKERGYTGSITGLQNEDAAKESEISVFTIPWEHAFSTAELLKDALRGKIVVSPLVPMRKVDNCFVYTQLPEGSAAEKLSLILDKSRIVSAYHSIPADKFADLDARFSWDVPVCGDYVEAKKAVIELTNQIEGLRALDAGPLASSSMIEGLVPLILNLMSMNGMKDLGVKFL
jgi:hypothetical protein